MDSLQINYITGEKIQELTDFTVILNAKDNGDSALLRNQLKNTKTNYHFFESNTTDIPFELQKAKSIFVYTHILDFFFNKIYPLLKNNFILVTHNSDAWISEKYKQYLDDPKIKKWFAQNVEYRHDKLIPIPIGVANSQWPHGNLNLFDKIRRENNKKEFLVYKNFDINTSHCNRMHVAKDTQFIPMIRGRSQEDYWRDISKSVFNICPMGGGTDSHRMWESLYLNSIPIVVDCVHNEGFNDLPMLKIPRQEGAWKMLNQEFLKSAYRKITEKVYNYEKLDLEYWKNLIQQEIV